VVQKCDFYANEEGLDRSGCEEWREFGFRFLGVLRGVFADGFR
jgi:hypothetical protein